MTTSITHAQLRAAGVDVPAASKRAKRAKAPVQLRGEHQMMIWLVLPHPPTVNTYWRRRGGQYYIAKAGKRFREAVLAEVLARGFGHVTGRLTVKIWVHAPDKRTRDLDNLVKGILDSCQSAGLFADDGQVDRLEITRQGNAPGGKCTVQILGECQNV